MGLRKLRPVRSHPGVIRPLLAHSRDSGLRVVLQELEGFYSAFRSDRCLRFVRGSTVPVVCSSRVLSDRGLYANVNINYLGRILDDNPPPGKWQQGFGVYFHVLAGYHDLSRVLSFRERDDFLDYLRKSYL